MENIKKLLELTENKFTVNICNSEGIIDTKIMTLTEINTKLMFDFGNVNEISIWIKE